MKTVTVSSKSWHYWLAERGNFNPKYEGDFCHYLGSVVGGAILVFACTWLVIVAAFVVGDFLGWLAALLAHGWVGPTMLTAIGLLFITGGVIYLFYRGIRTTVDEVEFVHDAYTSLRDRICYRIEIK